MPPPIGCTASSRATERRRWSFLQPRVKRLQRYGDVEFVEAHVEAASGACGGFELRTKSGSTYRGRRLLLATGVYDALPAIDGLREAWGRSAFVCPYCDGWEMRGRRIAVVGQGDKAVELAQELYQWSKDVIACTQNAQRLDPEMSRWLEAAGVARIDRAVRRIRERDGQIEGIVFEGDRYEACDALFLSAPLRPRYPLVDMLGCRVREDGQIEIDERGRTTVTGVYAAGDAVTVVHQVVLAAASGVCAAMALNEDLLRADVSSLTRRV